MFFSRLFKFLHFTKFSLLNFGTNCNRVRSTKNLKNRHMSIVQELFRGSSLVSKDEYMFMTSNLPPYISRETDQNHTSTTIFKELTSCDFFLYQNWKDLSKFIFVNILFVNFHHYFHCVCFRYFISVIIINKIS